MKLATVIGARPQFIKAAVVSRQLKEYPHIEEVLLHTGQHYDDNMSQIFFNELDIPQPDYNLGAGSGNHGAQTAFMLERLEALFIELEPTYVLVYGDTNSTLAGALAAAKLNIPVAHIEAGLRSFNRAMPEEINRVLTDHVSDLLFAPTSTAVENLQREGIAAERIHQTGDVMYDAALFYAKRAAQQSRVLEELGLLNQDYVLATIHRASNTVDPQLLKVLFDGLTLVAQQMPVVLPLHPRTRAALERHNWLSSYTERLQLIDPVGYLDMIQLEQHAAVIATDSGGVQKEAFFYKVPCVTLRHETEWVELVESKVNVLCPPTNSQSIFDCIMKQAATTVPEHLELYGDGTASAKIAVLLQKCVAR